MMKMESRMPEYASTISREEVNALPTEQFNGRIVVISEQEAVSGAVAVLRREKVLGFDTETKPSFKKGQIHQVALLQLATKDIAYLFRLNYIGLPPELVNILADENIIKVGAAIKDDILSLQKLTSFVPGGFIELQEYVKEFNIESNALRKISAIVLNFKISKSQQVSNWEREGLTEAQEIYAATDAWVSYMIYQELETKR